MAGKPQKLSQGQKEEVIKIVRGQVVRGVLIILSLLGGIGGGWRVADIRSSWEASRDACGQSVRGTPH